MAECHMSDRMRRAKSEVTRSHSSVDALKNEFRNRFLSRLRYSRSRSVDRFRQIVEDYGENISYKSIRDLRSALLHDREAVNLLKTEDVNDILKEIEKELAQVKLQNEGEQYIKENENEMQDIVSRHLQMCTVCDGLTGEGNVCTKCLAAFQSELD